MPSFACLAVAVTAALAMVSSSALAMVDVEGNSVTFAWTPSTGPVAYYSVHLDRNGEGFSGTALINTPEPRVTLQGEFGETIRICVIAWGEAGELLIGSAPSDISEEAQFVEPVSGGGGSTPPPPPTPEGTLARPYDFDGDGRTDLLWRNTRTNALAMWFMDGTVTPRYAGLGMLGPNKLFLGSGDFDGDGKADLLLQSGPAYEIWFMNGSLIRESTPLGAPADCSGVDAIGDFDGDGYADLLWRCQQGSLVSFMRGATVNEEAVGVQAPGEAACAPDLDADGRSDVVWNVGGGAAAAWMMLGSPFWRSEDVAEHIDSEMVGVGCGDTDGDGFDDVLWYHQGVGITLWKTDGDAGVDQSFDLPQLGLDWTLEISGDFDGDGRANDILVRNTASGWIQIWELHWNGELTNFGIVAKTGAGLWSGDWDVVAP